MPLMVIKKDQTREPYDRSKIEAGVVHSCHKRPVSTQQINQMIDEIENRDLYHGRPGGGNPPQLENWSCRS